MAYYHQEVQENEAKLAEMKASSDVDEYDIKRFQQVLDESYMMVPDSEKRFQQSIEDLEKFVEQILQDKSQEVVEGEWLSTAQALLQDQKDKVEQGIDSSTPQTNVDDLAAGEAF